MPKMAIYPNKDYDGILISTSTADAEFTQDLTIDQARELIKRIERAISKCANGKALLAIAEHERTNNETAPYLVKTVERFGTSHLVRRSSKSPLGSPEYLDRTLCDTEVAEWPIIAAITEVTAVTDTKMEMNVLAAEDVPSTVRSPICAGCAHVAREIKYDEEQAQNRTEEQEQDAES